MLTHNKRRLAASTAGIACAVLLMFTQIGFLNAMFDSATELIRVLDADLVVISKLTTGLTTTAGFPRARLYQALGVDGVTQAEPVFIEAASARWKNPDDGTSRPIRVLAFDPDRSVLTLPDVERAQAALKMPDTALVDVKSKPLYGDRREGLTTELARRSIRVVGLFALGTDLANDGTIIVSTRTFGRFFPHRRAADGDVDGVELGVIRLAAGADVESVRRALARTLPPDVLVFTKQEFMQRERAHWQGTTPIGFIFGLGTAVGFLIGVMICYQILFTDVTDHLPQFATAKAIGYSNGYLARLIVYEALLLSLVGFAFGLAGGQLLYWALAALTGMLMYLTPGRVALIFTLTVTMTIVSALFAARKAMATDPAEVF
jgi:putative ABC transport system permease protein